MIFSIFYNHHDYISMMSLCLKHRVIRVMKICNQNPPPLEIEVGVILRKSGFTAGNQKNITPEPVRHQYFLTNQRIA